ncbi:MAG: riboflavin synthase [Acidimicrobiia bacterium]
MFTGIIEEQGRVRSVVPAHDGARVEIEADKVLDVEIGDSIAVNGCCLTVAERGSGWWAADAVSETLTRTSLGALQAGDPVNLERPVRLVDRLGGHLVQGHVDGVGRVRARRELPDDSAEVAIDAPAGVHDYLVEKGSVAVDGISLTVVAVDDEGFSVAVIPHTLAVTTLGTRQPGDAVNLEVDLIAKYVERLTSSHPARHPRKERASGAPSQER